MFGRKKRRLSDFDTEIKSHLDIAAQQFHEDGLNEREAQYAALRQFGNVMIARERFYEAGRWRWLDTMRFELLHALKDLVRTPRFAIPAVLTLALGLAGAMTFFNAFYSVLLRTLPFPASDRIYRLVTNTPEGPIPWIPFDYAFELRRLSPDVEYVGLMVPVHQSYWIQDAGGSVPVRVLSYGAYIQEIAGLQASTGTLFQEDSFATGNGVILSHRFWKSKLGGDPAAVGRILNLNNKRQRIVGVLKPGAEVPLSPEADILAPIKTLKPEELNGSNATWLVLLRLRSGIRPEAVLPRFQEIARRMERRPGIRQNPALQSVRQATADDADLRFFIVCAAAALFLLLAIANVACLFLARAAEKAWEISVRLCLGAPAFSLLRKFLAEGLVVALVSAGVAFLLNFVLAGSLRRWLPGGASLPGLNGTWDHFGVASFGLGLVTLITLFLGLIPMLQIHRLDLSLATQEGHRTQSARTNGRTVLVVVQMALATLLLCATALLGRSLWGMVHYDPGFKPDNLVMVRLLYDRDQEPGKRWKNSVFLPALRSQSGIQSAALTTGFGGAVGSTYGSRGKNLHVGNEEHPLRDGVRFVFVGEKTFETLGVSLIQGHDLTIQDIERPAYILNRETERVAGIPSGQAVGQKFYWDKVPVDIVGVVPDFSLFQYSEPAEPTLYMPLASFRPDALFVRSALPRKDLEATITSVMLKTFPGAKLGVVSEMSELRGEKSLPHRQILGLLACFGGTSILLAALGLSALLSDSVSRRKRELGIRSTLGAAPRLLLRQVLVQGCWRTGLGVSLGLASALALGRYLQSLLFGVRANDPRILVAVASFLTILGLASSFIPALRAASMDPAKTLREQ